MVWPSARSVWLHSFEFGLLMVGNLTSVGALLPTSGAFVASITVQGDSTRFHNWSRERTLCVHAAKSVEK